VKCRRFLKPLLLRVWFLAAMPHSNDMDPARDNTKGASGRLGMLAHTALPRHHHQNR
jgi:hypothetical protein